MPNNKTRHFSLFSHLLILAAFLADRLSKRWAAAYLAQHGPTRFNAFFTLRETYNEGIALGMFQGIGRLMGWLTVAVLVGLYLYQLGLPRNIRLHRAGISLIIGGALGNLVDRIWVGQVLDFIQTPLPTGIFNVADVMIHLGLILTIISALLAREPGEASPASDDRQLETL